MVRRQLHKSEAHVRQATNSDLLSFYSRLPHQMPWFASFRERIEKAIQGALESIAGSKLKYVSFSTGHLAESSARNYDVCIHFSTPDVRNSFSITARIDLIDSLVSCLFGINYSEKDHEQSDAISPVTAFLVDRIGEAIGAALQDDPSNADGINFSHHSLIDVLVGAETADGLDGASVDLCFEWNDDPFWITLNVKPDYCSRLMNINRTTVQSIDNPLPAEIYHHVTLPCGISTISREIAWADVSGLSIGSVISLADMNCLKAALYIGSKQFWHGDLRIESKKISIQL